MLEIIQRKTPRLRIKNDFQFALFQHIAIGISQHRQQHFAAQRFARRLPIDIEEFREAGSAAIFQNIQPPNIIAAHAHVVGHNVKHLPHACRGHRRRELFVFFAAAELGIEAGVIDDIVTMHAARPGFQIGRGVTMADAQFRQIGHQIRGIAKAKPAVELQPVSGAGDPGFDIHAAVLRCCDQTTLQGARPAPRGSMF